MRNKFLALLLTAVCITGLTACGNGGETVTETEGTVTEEVTETTETEGTTEGATEEATEGTEEEAPVATNNGYYDADGNIIMIDTEGVLTGEQKRERDKEVFAFLTMEWERSPKWDEPFYDEHYNEEVLPSESAASFTQIGDAFFYNYMTDEEKLEVWNNSQIGQMWNKYADEYECIRTDTKILSIDLGLSGSGSPSVKTRIVSPISFENGFYDTVEYIGSDDLVDNAFIRHNADDITTTPYDFDTDPIYDEDITGVVKW